MGEKKILMLETMEDFKAIYALNFKVYLGAEIETVKTFDQATKCLASHDFSLIFIDGKGYSKDMAFELWEHLHLQNKMIPLYLIGKSKTPAGNITTFSKQLAVKDILQSMAKHLGVTAQDMASEDVPDYFPLPLSYIVPGWGASVNVFIRDGQNYKSSLQSGSIITQKYLDQLEQSEHTDIYVKKADRLKFVNGINSVILDKLKNPSLSPLDKIKAGDDAYKMVFEQAQRIGIGESTLEMADACITNMKRVTKSLSKISELIAQLMKDEMSYRYRHSFLSIFISSHIIENMQWGTPEQQEKIAFVSFFHDITLPNDEFAKFKSDKEVKKSSLSPGEKELILNHAASAALLVAGQSRIPMGADTIIKQHHGSKSGKGLSKLSLTISPLAIVFILAHHWAEICIEGMEKEYEYSKDEVMEIIMGTYNLPVFKKYFPVLNKLDI